MRSKANNFDDTHELYHFLGYGITSILPIASLGYLGHKKIDKPNDNSFKNQKGTIIGATIGAIIATGLDYYIIYKNDPSGDNEVSYEPLIYSGLIAIPIATSSISNIIFKYYQNRALNQNTLDSEEFILNNDAHDRDWPLIKAAINSIGFITGIVLDYLIYDNLN